jgi:hypothetical protein
LDETCSEFENAAKEEIEDEGPFATETVGEETECELIRG